jgi:hypothetical protein
MRRLHIRIVAVAAAVLLQPLFTGAADGANPRFAAGVTAYGGKHFREAVNCFSEVLRTEPRNVSAAYYLAMSYYSLGQLTAALGYFRWIADNFSFTTEGAQSKSILVRLEAQGITRSGAVPTPSVAVGAPKRSDASGELSRSPESGAAVDAETMVVVVRNLADHPPVEKSTVEGIKDTLRAMPPGVLWVLTKQNCHVRVTPTSIDQEPNLRYRHPGGYEEGKTYTNVPGFFNGKDVIVCNYAMRDNDDWEPTPDPNGCVRHEVGHALDRFLGNLSDQKDFMSAYYYDCGRLEPEQQSELAYFLQKGPRGRAECFAECACTIFGGRTKNKERTEHIRAAFPHVIQYMEKKIASLK